MIVILKGLSRKIELIIDEMIRNDDTIQPLKVYQKLLIEHSWVNNTKQALKQVTIMFVFVYTICSRYLFFIFKRFD